MGAQHAAGERGALFDHHAHVTRSAGSKLVIGMRLDKFLWCVRLFKTRSLATDAMRRGQVKLNDREVKPSAEIKAGDVFSLRVPPVWRSWKIIAIPASRVGAKLVPDLMAETTSFDDLEKAEIARHAKTQFRSPGEGRPTKKERRDIDRFRPDR